MLLWPTKKLRAYAKKWDPTHKCQKNVSLHMVEELWQMISSSDDSVTKAEDSDSREERDPRSFSPTLSCSTDGFW